MTNPFQRVSPGLPKDMHRPRNTTDSSRSTHSSHSGDIDGARSIPDILKSRWVLPCLWTMGPQAARRPCKQDVFMRYLVVAVQQG